ncbi:MAG: hypothetical protein M9894_16165 [Planctomycetes bacterium]|nr:hypothetical protein [Planctomycetota bacterium]
MTRGRGGEDLDETLQRLVSSLGEFEAAVEDATAALSEVAEGPEGDGAPTVGDAGGGGGGGRGGARGGARVRGSRLGGMARGGLMALAGIGADSVGNMVTTGDLGSGTAARGAVDLIGAIPGLGQITGMRQTSQTLDRAQARVGAVTEDLARYGIEVDPELRSGLAKTAVEQEKRVQTERGRVAAEIGSSDNIGEAMPNAIGEALSSLDSTLKQILAAVGRFTGGGN